MSMPQAQKEEKHQVPQKKKMHLKIKKTKKNHTSGLDGRQVPWMLTPCLQIDQQLFLIELQGFNGNQRLPPVSWTNPGNHRKMFSKR